MLYVRGTIARNDGKRMTQKRANAVFDEFLVWLGETQASGFVGCFDPAYRYGNHYTVTRKEAGWSLRKTNNKTTKRKTTKRKAKR